MALRAGAEDGRANRCDARRNYTRAVTLSRGTDISGGKEKPRRVPGAWLRLTRIPPGGCPRLRLTHPRRDRATRRYMGSRSRTVGSKIVRGIPSTAGFFGFVRRDESQIITRAARLSTKESRGHCARSHLANGKRSPRANPARRASARCIAANARSTAPNATNAAASPRAAPYIARYANPTRRAITIAPTTPE